MSGARRIKTTPGGAPSRTNAQRALAAARQARHRNRVIRNVFLMQLEVDEDELAAVLYKHGAIRADEAHDRRALATGVLRLLRHLKKCDA